MADQQHFKTSTSRGPKSLSEQTAPKPLGTVSGAGNVPTHGSQLPQKQLLTLDEVNEQYPSNRWFGVDVELDTGVETVAFRGPKLVEQRMFQTLTDRLDALGASLHVLATLSLTHSKDQLEAIADEVPSFLGTAGAELKRFMTTGSSPTKKS